MSQTSRATEVRWPVAIALAVPALVVTIIITFTPGHTVWFGFIVFGAWALLTAAGSGVGIGLLPRGAARGGAVAKVVVGGVAGLAALGVAAILGWFMPATAPGGDSASLWAPYALALSLTIAGTFVAFGVTDLVVGSRSRRRDRFARDWLAAGVVQAVAAIAIVAVPPTFYQGFSFTDKGEFISGAVTSSTMIVGLFGAAIAIVGVLYAIAGVGLIPERVRHERAAA